MSAFALDAVRPAGILAGELGPVPDSHLVVLLSVFAGCS
ncbi:hypothetical protein ARTSIC4J27_4188 [Pseudarthrobacter siccitolerans]|uniref:Uncharacterized protein n=1 Tax=Pseudarthrobacter siccitolerans TaxID=861266 RepID=A0A024H8V8_9MICC|nr:hypothetical protein ARTSIC4J27_4188 [Pseudarthrobacter siccitolerans]